MNEKISLPGLVTLLSAKTADSKKESEEFIKEFFAVVADALSKGKSVKIKGIGVFKTVVVEARKSVNVSTGEDNLIPSHKKIVFNPSKEMAAEVNSPFDMFETVELMDDEDFETPEEGMLEENPVEAEPQKAEIPAESEIEKVEAVAAQAEAYAAKTETAAANAEVEAAKTETDEAEVEAEAAEAEAAKAEAEAAKAEAEVEKIEAATVKVGAKKPVKAGEVEVEPEPEPAEKVVEVEPAPAAKPEPAAEYEPVAEHEPAAEVEAEPAEMIDEEAVALPPRRRGRFWIGFASGCALTALAVVILLFILHFPFDYNGGKQQDSATVNVEKTEQQPAAQANAAGQQDASGNPADVTEVAANQEGDEAIANSGSENADGEDVVPTAPSDKKVYDTISTTRYLTTMAKDHYGNYNLWPYIYKENSKILGHPDRIRPGTKVVIPPLSKYGVDPKNPEDIKKAKKLGVEIYSRYN